MTFRSWWWIVGGLWLCLLGVEITRGLTAQGGVRRGLAQVADQERDLDRLQRAGMGRGGRTLPTGKDDLVSQVQQSLAASGVAPAAFRGVQPLGERLDPATRLNERTVQVHFEGIRPGDLGAWLAAWCTPGQAWRVSGISWNHLQQQPQGNPIDTSGGFVTVELSSAVSAQSGN